MENKFQPITPLGKIVKQLRTKNKVIMKKFILLALIFSIFDFI